MRRRYGMASLAGPERPPSLRLMTAVTRTLGAAVFAALLPVAGWCAPGSALESPTDPTIAAPAPIAAAHADSTTALPPRADVSSSRLARPATAAAAGTVIDPPGDLRHVSDWTVFRSRRHLASLPTEARLFYRRGLIAHQSGQLEDAMLNVRGAAELDPAFVEPHLTLASWMLTQEPGQALQQYAIVLELVRQDFNLQIELVANAFLVGYQALFAGLLLRRDDRGLAASRRDHPRLARGSRTLRHPSRVAYLGTRAALPALPRGIRAHDARRSVSSRTSGRRCARVSGCCPSCWPRRCSRCRPSSRCRERFSLPLHRRRGAVLRRVVARERRLLGRSRDPAGLARLPRGGQRPAAVRSRLDRAPRRATCSRPRTPIVAWWRSGPRAIARGTTSATSSRCRAVVTTRSPATGRPSKRTRRTPRPTTTRSQLLHPALRIPGRHRRPDAGFGAQLRPGSPLPGAGLRRRSASARSTSGSNPRSSGRRCATRRSRATWRATFPSACAGTSRSRAGPSWRSSSSPCAIGIAAARGSTAASTFASAATAAPSSAGAAPQRRREHALCPHVRRDRGRRARHRSSRRLLLLAPPQGAAPAAVSCTPRSPRSCPATACSRTTARSHPRSCFRSPGSSPVPGAGSPRPTRSSRGSRSPARRFRWSRSSSPRPGLRASPARLFPPRRAGTRPRSRTQQPPQRGRVQQSTRRSFQSAA